MVLTKYLRKNLNKVAAPKYKVSKVETLNSGTKVGTVSLGPVHNLSVSSEAQSTALRTQNFLLRSRMKMAVVKAKWSKAEQICTLQLNVEYPKVLTQHHLGWYPASGTRAPSST